MNALLRTSLRAANKYVPGWPAAGRDLRAVALCVYRSRNARHLHRMIRQLPEGVETRLHALDETLPELAGLTLSSGPGMRTLLLQQLADAKHISADAWVLLFDDDCNFSLPGVTRFLQIATRAQLDVAGAAIDVGQPHSFNHTVVRPFSMARLVRLVEIGPVVALSPRAQSMILPFPADAGMGWGLDVLWSTFGLRMGYVDATPIQHHGEVAASYESESERSRMSRHLEAAGISSVYELVGTVARWRKWNPRAPWVRRS